MQFRGAILWASIVIIVLLSVIYFSNVIQVASSPPEITVVSPTIDTPRWQEYSNLPEPRAGMGGVTYDNKIYLVGGRTPSGVSRDAKRFTTSIQGVGSTHQKPTAVSGIQAALIGEKDLCSWRRTHRRHPK